MKRFIILVDIKDTDEDHDDKDKYYLVDYSNDFADFSGRVYHTFAHSANKSEALILSEDEGKNIISLLEGDNKDYSFSLVEHKTSFFHREVVGLLESSNGNDNFVKDFTPLANQIRYKAMSGNCNCIITQELFFENKDYTKERLIDLGFLVDDNGNSLMVHW